VHQLLSSDIDARAWKNELKAKQTKNNAADGEGEKKPRTIDLAKRPWKGKNPLHKIVAWMQSAVAGGAGSEQIPLSQPLVQPVNSPFSSEKEALVHRTDSGRFGLRGID
jgi:hypothetical protein